MITEIDQIRSWSDTLGRFLSESNEDEKVVDVFRQKVLPGLMALAGGNKLSWLEVGPGTGSKTRLVAELLAALPEIRELELTLCEPSDEWRSYLEVNEFYSAMPDNCSVTISGLPVEKMLARDELPEWQFISLIQVLYSDSIKKALVNYIESRPSDRRSMIWVDVEDESNDFYKMRRLLGPMDGLEVAPFLDELVEELRRKGINFDIFRTQGKTCPIDLEQLNTDNEYWLFPFVLGLSFEQYAELAAPERAQAVGIIREYVNSSGDALLQVADKSALIYI